MLPARIAILGTGLIGGSLGLALRRADPQVEIRGFDLAPGVAERALAMGAISTVHTSPHAAVRDAALVVLAMPVDRMASVCGEISRHTTPGATVTDVGSSKAMVVAAGEDAFGDRFVGGHPMAGSERHGIDAADVDLFEEAWWLVTPTDRTSPDAYRVVSEVAQAAGAQAVALEPEAHDELVARLSHLPQVVASAIVQVAADRPERDALLGLAGGGFRDVTRIAASEPGMWMAIFRTNRAAVLHALDAIDGRLAEVRLMLEGGRWDQLHEWLDAARRARGELFVKPGMPAETMILAMAVPDRPGVLAEVTTVAGRLGANIEDLRIVHSTEGGRGRLELLVGRGSTSDALTSALEELGYHVHEGGAGTA